MVTDMAGVLEISLGTASGWVTPRSYGVVLDQLTYSLEELDRLAEPVRKRRAVWRVVNTGWKANGPTISLQPDVARDRRSAEDLLRPSMALVQGVRRLHTEPEIPQHFSEDVMNRVAAVAGQISRPDTGITAVLVQTVGVDDGPAAIDDEVTSNVARAVESASIAYGSVVGTLDLISTRGKHDRVGLLSDLGPPINCVVDSIPRGEFLARLDQRVIVAGLIKRNGRGQIVRIDADMIEPAPMLPPLRAADFLGAIQGGPSIAEYLQEQRGN
jgi:hypothetical protein